MSTRTSVSRGTKLRVAFCVALLAVIGACSCGCFPIWFNPFQTARIAKQGELAVALGLSMFGDNELQELVIAASQIQLSVGVSERVDIGIQSGFWSYLTEEQEEVYSLEDPPTGRLHPLGAIAEAKLSVLDGEIALSLGGGYSCEFYTAGVLGWGLKATAYYTIADVLSGSLCVLYPLDDIPDPFSLSGENFPREISIVGVAGLSLDLSDSVALLIEVGTRFGTSLFGVGVGLRFRGSP